MEFQFRDHDNKNHEHDQDMWEVDPETRSKLHLIQKENGNKVCCDCGAPSPRWASPKFGIFLCLTCAGTHRGLGVHISFVRSVDMDAFKTGEILRMEKGGNDPWKRFFNNHDITKAEGLTFEGCTISDRYGGEVGEEYKERLTCKVEGTEYVKKAPSAPKPVSRTGTPVGGLKKMGGMGPSSRSESPAARGGPPGRKEQNESYFAKLGNANASRPDGLPPSQGGKFGGFGSEPPPASRAAEGGAGVPSAEEFQKDPMGALTKGFGWFASTVGKQAKTVHESYLQPAAKTIAESDLAAQARLAAAQAGQGIQTVAKSGTESLSRFVEGDNSQPGGARSRGTGAAPERKDFWDSFGDAGANKGGVNNSSIGTAAMGKGGKSGGGGGKGKDEGSWGDDW